MTSNRHQDKTDSPSKEDKAIAELAASSLDESVAQYDAATLSRLRAARQSAVAQSQQSLWQRFALPASAAFAGVAALLIIPLLTIEPGQNTPASYSAAEDAELVENLDLVLWLMDEGDHAS